MDKSFHEQIIIVPVRFENNGGKPTRLNSKEERLYAKLEQYQGVWQSIAYEILEETKLKLPVLDSLVDKGMVTKKQHGFGLFYQPVGHRIVQRT